MIWRSYPTSPDDIIQVHRQQVTPFEANHAILEDTLQMSETMRAVYGYFVDLGRITGGIPSYKDFDIVEIMSFGITDTLWLSEQRGDDYYIRVCGQGIEQIFKKRLNRICYRDVFSPDIADIMVQYFNQIYERQVGAFSSGRIYDFEDKCFDGERMVIPLQNGENHLIFGCTNVSRGIVSADLDVRHYFWNFEKE
ncbi:MAG: hypothetical protein AAF220_10135 [Pseudomonadota bacterium]